MDKTITLAIGERFHLKRGKDRIAYAGMPSEDVYSIVQIKASGYQGYSWSPDILNPLLPGVRAISS